LLPQLNGSSHGRERREPHRQAGQPPLAWPSEKLPRTLATGCPPITAAEIVLAGRRAPRAVPPPGALPPIAPRRNILDRLLQQHAGRAGAQVQYRTSFRDWRDGVVTLDRHQVRTRLLIGADGRRSKVAGVVHAPYQELRPGRSCAWYAYWDGAHLDQLRAELRTGIFAGAFPTHAGQVLAFTQLPVGAWRHDRGGDDYLVGLRAGSRTWTRPSIAMPPPSRH
jgi:flavin-dependent dehydrogenase